MTTILHRLSVATLCAALTGQVCAQESPPPNPVLDVLGSSTIGVAWQVTEFDVTPEAECCTTSMSDDRGLTPVLYAQIPVRMFVGDLYNGLGWTVRAGYRRFELTRQDLGAAPTVQQGYGTRVSGSALYVMPYFVAKTGSANYHLAAGLGLGVGQFSASGDIVVRRAAAGYSIERELLDVNAMSSSFGAFAEYRIGPVVAAMETAMMIVSKGGQSYEMGISSFSLAWRVDF